MNRYELLQYTKGTTIKHIDIYEYNEHNERVLKSHTLCPYIDNDLEIEIVTSREQIKRNENETNSTK